MVIPVMELRRLPLGFRTRLRPWLHMKGGHNFARHALPCADESCRDIAVLLGAWCFECSRQLAKSREHRRCPAQTRRTATKVNETSIDKVLYKQSINSCILTMSEIYARNPGFVLARYLQDFSNYANHPPDSANDTPRDSANRSRNLFCRPIILCRSTPRRLQQTLVLGSAICHTDGRGLGRAM